MNVSRRNEIVSLTETTINTYKQFIKEGINKSNAIQLTLKILDIIEVETINA